MMTRREWGGVLWVQMSTAYTPLVGSPNDWFHITGASVGLTALLLAVAKTKKWL